MQAFTTLTLKKVQSLKYACLKSGFINLHDVSSSVCTFSELKELITINITFTSYISISLCQISSDPSLFQGC